MTKPTLVLGEAESPMNKPSEQQLPNHPNDKEASQQLDNKKGKRQQAKQKKKEKTIEKAASSEQEVENEKEEQDVEAKQRDEKAEKGEEVDEEEKQPAAKQNARARRPKAAKAPPEPKPAAGVKKAAAKKAAEKPKSQQQGKPEKTQQPAPAAPPNVDSLATKKPTKLPEDGAAADEGAAHLLARRSTADIEAKQRARKSYKARKERFYRSLSSLPLSARMQVCLKMRGTFKHAWLVTFWCPVARPSFLQRLAPSLK